MKIFIINLERASDRRGKMILQLKEAGVEGIFFKAVDGRNLTEKERNSVNHRRRKAVSAYPLSDGEIACWLSHLAVMQAFLQTDEKMCVILEDDAGLTPAFAEVLTEAEKISPEKFDFILLHRKFKKPKEFIFCRKLGSENALGRIKFMSMDLTGYLVSRQGAEKFLASETIRQSGFSHAVDVDLHRWWQNGLNIFALEKPAVFNSDPEYSYIDETRQQNNVKQRQAYPDAWRFDQVLLRRLTRFQDSCRKRLAFRSYVRQGRKIADL